MALPHEMIPSEARPEDKRFASLPHAKFIPKPAFTMLIVAPIGQGKSSIIYSMLNKWYGKYFDELIIYNGTKDSNDAWLNLPPKEVVLLNEWNESDFFEYVKALEESQLKRVQEGKPPRNIGIVFDDMITDSIFSRGRSTALDQFVIKIRHIPASLIMSTQSYKLVSTTSRRNMTHIAILPVNEDEIVKIAEEHSGLMKKDEFIKMYKQVVSKKERNYLVIDYRDKIPNRFKEKFEKVIPYLKTTEKSSALQIKDGSSRQAQHGSSTNGRKASGARGAGEEDDGETEG
jgi:hypothetical protein